MTILFEQRIRGIPWASDTQRSGAKSECQPQSSEWTSDPKGISLGWWNEDPLGIRDVQPGGFDFSRQRMGAKRPNEGPSKGLTEFVSGDV